MEEDLHALLLGHLGITDLCADRIFWGMAAQGVAMPYITLHLIGGSDGQHFTGRDGLWRYRVQVDCYGEDRPSVTALKRAVMGLLNGFAQPYGVAGLRLIEIDSQREEPADPMIGYPAQFSLDFNVIWRGSNG